MKKKRTIIMILPTNGKNVKYRVVFDEWTFQGFAKYNVERHDTGARVFHFQTDDDYKELIAYYEAQKVKLEALILVKIEAALVA